MPVKRKVVSKHVRSMCDGHWEWFMRSDKPPYEITGKYLFFSSDRTQLVKLVVEELENGGFHEAKIPMEGKNLARDYVLCLYYKDDSRKRELADKYRNQLGISYRYWKTDAATLKGQYSTEFLQGLSPELKDFFTAEKEQ